MECSSCWVMPQGLQIGPTNSSFNLNELTGFYHLELPLPGGTVLTPKREVFMEFAPSNSLNEVWIKFA